jgi:hypothetical protein
MKSNKAVIDQLRHLLRERSNSTRPPHDSSLSPEARDAIRALRDERRLTREKLDRAATI